MILKKINSFRKRLFLLGLIVMYGCGPTAKINSMPIENIDLVPLKTIKLTELQKRAWSHLDITLDTVPGISLDRAYKELIKKKGDVVIVAVIDSGIDIEHEDLAGKIWSNAGEIPGNGKDDDKNGYIDDINGWNFLGESNDEQLEYVRLLASRNAKDPRYLEAKKLHAEEGLRCRRLRFQYKRLLSELKKSNDAMSLYLGKKEYSNKELDNIRSENKVLLGHTVRLREALSLGFESVPALMESLDRSLRDLNARLDYSLNIYFNGREAVGDDPENLSDVTYGDNNIHAKDGRTHGTHVSGIIAAQRNNGVGMNGVANNVEIMGLRCVPRGDEYDKDIALAVYYAVDNGAKVINMSFGKGFSPHSKWVRDAIAYAADGDVLIVAAAGNDATDTDVASYFPNDQVELGDEVSDNFIKVGATGSNYGSSILAEYSNYGKNTVDVFAPGSQIYSTYPKQTYEYAQGTSMASPLVAGVAALIFSQYPKLGAAQVKEILMNSGLVINKKVSLENGNIVSFDSLSKSGKLINAYNALIMASKTSKK